MRGRRIETFDGHAHCYMDSNLQALDIAAALEEVSPQRREQALKYSHEAGRRQCLAAYMLLKEALFEDFGIEENPVFDYNDGGKPFLKDYPDIHFSISHCRNAVACVLHDAPVGIDIETIRPYKPNLAAYVLNIEELQEVEASPRRDIAFIRLWTMKESFLKMTGQGIRSDLKQVALRNGCFFTAIDEEKEVVITVCKARDNIQ
ncbi:MAG: 4'-phosphopantetheinyl transferase family protein [Prevotella sp.]